MKTAGKTSAENRRRQVKNSVKSPTTPKTTISGSLLSDQFPSTGTMSQVPPTSSSSTNFEMILTAALEEYRKQTKKDIASHPVAAQLKSCESPSAILTVLRAQVQAFDKSRSADEKLTRWLDPTVNVLYAFSAILGDTIGQVITSVSAVRDLPSDLRDRYSHPRVRFSLELASSSK